MNGRDGINGTMGHGVPIITPSTAKFEFTEMQFRMIQAQVKKFVGSQGGQVPVIDPLGFMAMGVILEKLTEITERLERIEAQSDPLAKQRAVLAGVP